MRGFRLLTSAATFALVVFATSLPSAFGQITNYGHGLHLDGTTSGTISQANFQSFPSTDITIEFWARSTNTSKNGSLFSYAVAGNLNAILIYDHQNLAIWVNNASTVQSGVSITDGLWHHIAVTWSTSGALQIFKDGALAFATNHQAGFVLPNNGYLVLGQDQDQVGGGFDPSQAFLGDLDELRVWSVVRTPGQIAQSATNILEGNEVGLTAYYHFNEGFGTGTANSTSGLNLLTLGTGASWFSMAPYNPGNAINLTSGFVEVPDSTAFNAYPVTFTAWVRITSSQTGNILQRAGANGSAIYVYVNQGNLEAYYLREGGLLGSLIFTGALSPGAIGDGLWHHIAFTVESSGGQFFVDGIRRAVRSWLGTQGPATTVGPLIFGDNEAGFSLNGQIDEAALWSFAMTSADVHRNMNRRLTGTEAGLVAAYHFDDGSGTQVVDASSGHHDGSLMYGAVWTASSARSSGMAQIRGQITSGVVGLPGTPVRALLQPVSAPPLLSLPDNQTVTSTNIVALPGTFGSMQVNVNLTHPYRGDLELTLIHPDGTEVRLKNSDPTDDKPNVLTSFPDPTAPVNDLNVLNGKPVAGAWRLRVADQFLLDSGLLNTWSLQFGPPATITDANGNYVFNNLLVGTYTVQPAFPGLVFNPTNRTSPVDRTNLDFALVTGFISGRVTANGTGLAGATLSAGSGFSTTTAEDGSYNLVNLPPGNKTVTISLPGYGFSPAQRPNTPLGTTNANFTVVGYPITGRITDVNSNGVPGVSVSANTASTPGISGEDGTYLISSALPGNVIIVPDKAGVTFSPEFLTRPLGPAQSNVNFIAIQSPPTITVIPNQVIARNGSAGPVRFDVNDSETPAVRLQVTGSSSNPNLIPSANILIDGVGIQRTVTVTPATNQSGASAVITLTVTDEAGASANRSFSVRINEPPLAGVNLALNFDGINDAAYGPAGVILDKGNYSVEAWVYAPSNSGSRTILSQGNRLALGLNAAGQIRASTNWNTGVAWPFGGWHHVALVRESDDTRLYVDGTLRASLGSALAQPLPSATFQVGVNGTSEYWLGGMDEVRVWRAARTAGQISSNMLVRVTGNEPDLASLWRFDERFGTTASNSVTSIGNLILTNGLSRVPSAIAFDTYVTRLGRDIHDVLQAYDADGDPLTFAIVSPTAKGTVSLVSSNTDGFIYTADGLGEDSFAFSVSDGYSSSEAHPVTIQVLPDVNPPGLSFLADQTIAEDTVLGPLAFTVTDAERRSQVLPVFAHSSDQTLVPDENIFLAFTQTNRTLMLRPATNQFGTTTISLTVTDGTQESTTSFLLTVTPVNDAPMFGVISNLVITRPGAVIFPIDVLDVDNNPVGLNISALSSAPSVLQAALYGGCPQGTGTCLIVTPFQSGTVTVTVTAGDTASMSSTNFLVTINNPPTIAPIADQATLRNAPTAPIAITLNDVDNVLDNVVLTASSTNLALVDTGFSFSGSGANRTLVITPIGGRIGQTRITVTARDAYHSSSQSFQLFVEGGFDYEVIRLPHIPGGDRSIALGLNENGKVVGWSAIGTSARAVVWDVNGVTPTVTQILGPDSVALSINNSGEIVARLNNQGVLYTNGVVWSIPNVFGTRCGVDINEGGEIAGGNVNNFTMAYFNPPDQTVLTNVFYTTFFAGEQRNLALNDLGDVFGVNGPGNTATHPMLWVAGPDRVTRTVVDLGAYSGSAYPLMGGINNVGQVCINSGAGNPQIYNYRTSTATTNLQYALSLVFPGVQCLARDINDSGEVVGGNPPFVYSEGRAYPLVDLMRDSGIGPDQARAINAYGDIAGYGGGPTAFMLRRRWYVGQPQFPPLQAVNPATGKAYRPPDVRGLDGSNLATDPNPPFVWSEFESKLFFIRPIEVQVTWFTSPNLQDTNATPVVRRGRVIWPPSPQLHIAGAPVDCGPIDASSPYRPIKLSYTTTSGATLDATTRTFNSPTPGYTVIRYLLAPDVALGGTPSELNHSNYFEVVQTIAWDEPAKLIDSQLATIGTKVTDPRGPGVITNSFKTGWTIFPLAPYDGAGNDRAYDRATQTGPIIPVNRDTASANDDLVVAYYKRNTLTTALWPDLAVRYSISWPTNAQPLVMANSDGSGTLPDAQYADKQIYFQASTNLPGFNPNEEHAFLAPTTSGAGVFALRNDLNRPETSEPFVLLKYRNPTNNEWQFKLFQPVVTDPTHLFTFNGEAGREILPPYPLGLFTICAGTTNIQGKAFRDYQGKYYASMGPTPADLNPQVIMRYWYPLQPGFFYDLNRDGTNDLPVGNCVQWRSIPPGSSTSQPVDVTYQIRWPDDAPTLEIGETLLNAKRGLPGIKNWASAQVVFDSLNPNGNTPLTNTARLYDPLSARTLWLTNLVLPSYQFPAEIVLTTVNGKQIFADLPFHLRSRLSYDPINKALSFAGFLNDTVVGEPLLLINVLSDKERLRLRQLSGESDFRRIIDALYDLTRNPNRVNILNPGQLPQSTGLLIGFTTKYTVRTTNGVGNATTFTTNEFFGTRPTGNQFAFLATNIVQEPLGDAPKALTAGLPVPPVNASFGKALDLNGASYVEVGNLPRDAIGNTLTFEAWVKPGRGGCQSILSRGNGLYQDTDFIFEIGYDGNICGPLKIGFFGAGDWDISAATIPTNQWTHVAVTFDGTEKRFYTNGVLDRVAPRSGSINQSGTPLYIGRQGELCNCNFMFGQLDDVRVWNVARSAAQIQDSMRRPLTGTEPALVGYWRFDEATSTNALDAADGLHNGILRGNPSRVASTVPAIGAGERYVVLAENNDPRLGALPVTLHVIRVFDGPFVGDLKIIPSDNVFDQRLTLRHSSDFGAEPDRLEFEWWYHPDNADFIPTELPTLNPDGTIANAKGWLIYTPALSPNKLGQNTITIGDGGETSQFTIADNWFISRYRGYNIGGQTNWSEWVGDPSSDATPRASLAQGWIKRVLQGINPFEARTTNFHTDAASTFASMLIQAGHRYEGDIALNPSGENLLSIGLIEAYTTVLNRGKSLSIDGLPPVDSDPLNNALLLAASRICDLYMLLGNEAFADAQDPTIGFFSDDLAFGTLATANFAFKNQLDSLLEEELTLLRGRDDSAAGVGGQPVYNRLLWNFTGSEGEVAYERTYNVADVNLDGVINESDARILFPQGHGDAWGHYLTAIKTYYDLLRHPRFTWIPRTESVDLGGTAVRVDFLDERKFASAAAAKAKAGTEIVDLTYRSRFVDDPEGQYQGYKDTRADRAWGVTEWARRAGQGAYFDWLVGNAILPSTDPNANHTGIQKIDRQTVAELDEIIGHHNQVQAQLDKADIGLNPLGLAKGVVPFDIDPNFNIVGSGIQGQRHFQQIYDRASKALVNGVAVWDLANQLSETLRRQQDDVDDFTANVADQERDFKNRLIEIFGYPYAGDIGAGKTYRSGYDGPDLYHYMYVNATELTGSAASSIPTNVLTGYFTGFQDGSNLPSFYFTDDLGTGTIPTGPVLAVQYPLAQGGWAFTAPASFGSRRAPGELQLAISDLLQEETRLKIALGNYDALIKNIKDAATLLQSRSALSNRVISVLTQNKSSLETLNGQIKSAQDQQIGLRRASSIVSSIADGVVDAVPDEITPYGVIAAIIKGVVRTAEVIVTQSLEGAADTQQIAENDHERSKESTQLQTDIDLEVANQGYEVQQQAAELLAMMRDEATLRLEAFNQAELVKQSAGRYQAALAAGQRLLEERTVFRQRTAGATQQNRYKDMAFRTFRNEALQKYRAQFDLAARYVYLAATAYDYEMNFLGTDNRAGRNFFTDIIRQRSLGQFLDGVPVAGGTGLADALGRLNQNFLVLESRFGLNNPQFETARFSLRKELFRIRDDSDDQWRAVLRQAVVQDLWQVPEFRRYCRPFAPESAGPQLGIVIRFPSTITFGLNFFGFPLGGGDTAYDASLFATKINSAGVWFSDYNGSGLANAPRVYLLPAGMDVQRSPTGNTLATREWKVVDQVIPVPFPIGASALNDPTWIPLNDSLAETFAQIRHFASFRAYHDAGDYDPAETTTDTRLIGRSVWNTDWMLIIPGGTFLSNPEQGIATFINSISDIKISLQCYSYSGD